MIAKHLTDISNDLREAHRDLREATIADDYDYAMQALNDIRLAQYRMANVDKLYEGLTNDQ